MDATIYFVAILVVVSIGLIVFAMLPKGKSDDDIVKRRIKGQSSRGEGPEFDLAYPRESVTRKVMKTVAPIAVRPAMITNPEQMSKLRAKLAAAGFRADNATTMFLASKTVIAVCAALAGLSIALSKGLSMQHSVGLVMTLTGLGFLAPNLWLSSAMKKRSNQIRLGLPDVLDLLVICVESGLGLDGAFQRVSDEMRPVHPTLSEELTIVTLESQMGVPRSEALGNLTKRSTLSELKSMVAIINQAERFGTSIARALRTQSDTLRTKRRQEAEERAQKTTVKLMAPLIMFIFPAIFVVLGGPAGLKLYDGLVKSGVAG